MLNIPNILTSFRIFLIPIFVVVYYLPTTWSAPTAAFIFWLAGITDLLDGYLARRLNQQTAFGAFLDPVADKIMVAVSLVMIVEHYAVIWITIPAMVMICRIMLPPILRRDLPTFPPSHPRYICPRMAGHRKYAPDRHACVFPFHGCLYRE